MDAFKSFQSDFLSQIFDYFVGSFTQDPIFDSNQIFIEIFCQFLREPFNENNLKINDERMLIFDKDFYSANFF